MIVEEAEEESAFTGEETKRTQQQPEENKVSTAAGSFYFGWNRGQKFDKTLFEFNLATKTLNRIIHKNCNFRKFRTIQVGQSLYALGVGSNQLFEYCNIESGSIRKFRRADLRIIRSDACLANFDNRVIFLCGGKNPKRKSEVYRSVDMY